MNTALACREPAPDPDLDPDPDPDPSESTRPRRRRISAKASAFIMQFAAQAFRDPDKAAVAVGFRRPGMGYQLASRLSDLIESERLRREMAEQMELGEALRLLAMVARDGADQKLQHSALRTVLQVHGVLSDKPLPPTDRRTLASQIEAIVGRVRDAVGRPGVRSRVRLAFEAESEPAPDAKP